MISLLPYRRPPPPRPPPPPPRDAPPPPPPPREAPLLAVGREPPPPPPYDDEPRLEAPRELSIASAGRSRSRRTHCRHRPPAATARRLRRRTRSAARSSACTVTTGARTAPQLRARTTGRLRRCARSTARRCAGSAPRVTRAVRRRRLADRAAHLPRLLVRLPLRALPATALPAVDRVAAGADVGVAIDVDVVAATPAVAIAAPRRADRGAPDHAGGHRGAGRVRVVVRRVRRRVIAPRGGAVHDDGRRVVLRNVDHLRIRRLDDDDLLLRLHHLLRVRLQVAGRLRLAPEDLHGLEHRALVGDDRLAERAGPVEVVAHHLDDVRIVQQRLHRVVPLVVDRQLRIGLALVEIAVGLDDLQRARRRGQDDRDQVVGIERDAPDQLR